MASTLNHAADLRALIGKQFFNVPNARIQRIARVSVTTASRLEQKKRNRIFGGVALLDLMDTEPGAVTVSSLYTKFRISQINGDSSSPDKRGLPQEGESDLVASPITTRILVDYPRVPFS